MRYRWVEQGKEHYTNAPFLRWEAPEPPYRMHVLAVFSRKWDYLKIPINLLTQETLQRLPAVKPDEISMNLLDQDLTDIG